jgi:lysine biosynthesis protein LysW
MKADCPSCDYKINFGGQARMGQRLTCPSCRVELEVIWLDPVELDFIYDDEDEDFDEDDYDD